MPVAIQSFSNSAVAALCVLIVSMFGLGWSTTSPAADGPATAFQFACPPVWPGLDGSQARLTNRPIIWHEYVFQQVPSEDGSFDTNQEMQLDCRYEGKRHLTLVLPGNNTWCKMGPLPGVPKVKTLVCTIHTNGQFPGEVIMRPAEPVTERTELNGMALRRDRETMREAATGHGYREEAGAPPDANPLIFTGPEDRMIVHFASATQLSRRIEIVKSISMYRDVTLRFGFGRDYVRIRDGHVDRWSGEDRRITIDLYDDLPKTNSLVLTDHEAGE